MRDLMIIAVPAILTPAICGIAKWMIVDCAIRGQFVKGVSVSIMDRVCGLYGGIVLIACLIFLYAVAFGFDA